MTKVRIHKKAIAKLKDTTKESFGDTIAALDEELEKVIEDPNAFADRGFKDWDIVDTGRLRDSQVVSVSSNAEITTAFWRWNPIDPETKRHYAGDVFAGFVSFSGNWIPGRNWPERAVERLDPFNFFVNSLRRKL